MGFPPSTYYVNFSFNRGACHDRNDNLAGRDPRPGGTTGGTPVGLLEPPPKQNDAQALQRRLHPSVNRMSAQHIGFIRCAEFGNSFPRERPKTASSGLGHGHEKHQCGTTEPVWRATIKPQLRRRSTTTETAM